MTGWPDQPMIYEINTAVWLDELSRTAGHLGRYGSRGLGCGGPGRRGRRLADGGLGAKPRRAGAANASAELQASFAETLPDLRHADVIGSPYCVRRYVIDAGFGGPDALAVARAALAARGPRLILDYVPNHVAADHPWVTSRPELFVRGDADDIKADSAGWMTAARQVLAHGRDPYFPPWPDVVQLDAFSPALRAAAAQALADIAGQCDGIRCDMAMLMTNQVFARTWGGPTGPAPDAEFWPTVLGALHTRHPETVLIAEAYWDMESALHQQGFNFCYDKRLYDRFLGPDASTVRDHLRADLSYQSRWCASWRTMTRPASPAAFRPTPNGPRPWPSPRFPARPCGTKDSSRAAGCGHRCSCPADRMRYRTLNSALGTAACWLPSPITTYGQPRGGCSRPAAGPTTSPAPAWPPGPGPASAAVTGMWSWSTSPASRPRRASRWTGRTCPAAAGSSPTS
jgi:hypothetical protein